MDTITAVLDGRMVNACSGAPVTARLTLKREGALYVAAADSSGAFSFGHLQAGPYRFRASATSYEALADTVLHLESGAVVHLQAALSPY